MQKANSVNPKTFGHGNTEPSMEKSKACVERRGFLSFKEENGIRRTIWKHIEDYRNDSLAQYLMCGNRLRSWYRHFPVPQHHRLVYD